MKTLNINILILIIFVITGKVSCGFHYPIDTAHSRDCHLDFSGLMGVCKLFSECKSAQNAWFGERVYPTLCYYKGFESIVCCLDEGSTPYIPPFRPPIINHGNNQHHHNGQQHRPFDNVFGPHNNGPNINQQFPNNGNNKITNPNGSINPFPINNGNNQGNFPNTNNQFPTFGNGHQNRPSSNNPFPIDTGSNQENFPNTNNQFPITSGNNQGNFPNTNNQFPNFGNEQQNRPNPNNQFPMNAEINQGNFPNTNNQFPNVQPNRPTNINQFPTNTGNNQGNFPNTNNQFPITSGNNQGSFPNTNNQFPSSGQQNLPSMNNQFPINTETNQENFPNSNNQFPTNAGAENNQGGFPNTNNQFPTSGNEQQNRPNSNNQFPINAQINQGNFPNTNNQFPNGQQNLPTNNNQFPTNTGNNQGNFPNTNNQFPIAPNSISQPDLLSDCTVVVVEDENNPLGSRCVVPDPKKTQNQNSQNQLGQDQPALATQAQSESANEPEEEEEYKPPTTSQDKCEAVYDVTPLVGGEPTKIGEYPFMAAIGWKKFDDNLEFNCGGFLVSREYVLTAAHCASLGGDKPFAVRTGGINLDNITSSNLDIPIEEIIVHPNYKKDQTYNDIALMRLSRRANDNLACLWQKNKIDKKYDEVKAIGYGHTHFGGPRSNSLLQIKLKLFDNAECSSYYKPETEFPNGIIDSQICSGDLTRAKDTCQGDSGGPIFIERTSTVGLQTPIVIGITSFGQGCAGEAPSIYTRISSYLDWIESVVWPDG